MHTLRRCHATQCGVKYCAPGAGGLPANYLLNLVLNLTLNVLDLGKLVFRGSPFDSCCNQLYSVIILRQASQRENLAKRKSLQLQILGGSVSEGRRA